MSGHVDAAGKRRMRFGGFEVTEDGEVLDLRIAWAPILVTQCALFALAIPLAVYAIWSLRFSGMARLLSIFPLGLIVLYGFAAKWYLAARKPLRFDRTTDRVSRGGKPVIAISDIANFRVSVKDPDSDLYELGYYSAVDKKRLFRRLFPYSPGGSEREDLERLAGVLSRFTGRPAYTVGGQPVKPHDILLRPAEGSSESLLTPASATPADDSALVRPSESSNSDGSADD